ncbi:hypothetical protein OVS_03510 [Mycoplasma ovis str. Michigan]|uniref:Uncharacterized protein n=1 Tax=Mycoplasma ovis str. Michigan TaxID=1415773 RepID=A0ABM5P1X7_9MOLU|nr:hypothetical protein OVS_03510 [Mycoplasma ovis str. Michigan]
MKLGYVSLFGTNKDTLNKLNEQELDKICKFQTDHIKRPKLNCGEYTQDLLHAQNYWILY